MPSLLGGKRAISRRTLLASTAAGLVLNGCTTDDSRFAVPRPWALGPDTHPDMVRAGPWKFFTVEEAVSMEAIVDRLIPTDELSPGGKQAGCVVFIDRQLAGAYGSSAHLYMQPPFLPGTPSQGDQSGTTPAATYRAGLRSLTAHCGTVYGKPFDGLSADVQDAILRNMESGTLRFDDGDSRQLFALLLQNTKEGFFADPIYGGNRDMVGWNLIGFPGAQYDYRDWIGRHNERFTPAPVGIGGRPGWQ